MRILLGVMLLAILATMLLAAYHGWKEEYNRPLGIPRVLGLAISGGGMVLLVGYLQLYARDGSLLHMLLVSVGFAALLAVPYCIGRLALALWQRMWARIRRLQHE